MCAPWSDSPQSHVSEWDERKPYPLFPSANEPDYDHRIPQSHGTFCSPHFPSWDTHAAVESLDEWLEAQPNIHFPLSPSPSLSTHKQYDPRGEMGNSEDPDGGDALMFQHLRQVAC